MYKMKRPSHVTPFSGLCDGSEFVRAVVAIVGERTVMSSERTRSDPTAATAGAGRELRLFLSGVKSQNRSRHVISVR